VTLALLVAPAALAAQARINQSAAFRKEPGGTVLGTLNAGTAVTVGKAQGDWTSVTIDGWVYTPSTGASARDGFEVAITARSSAGSRTAPSSTGSGPRASGPTSGGAAG